MRAKPYLQQAAYYRQRLKFFSEKIEELRTTMETTGAIRYDKLDIQETLATDPLLEHIVRLDELLRKFNEMNELYYEKLMEIQDRINGVENVLYRKILTYRYLEELPFEKIADRMGYTFDYIRSRHSMALLTFARQYAELLKSC